MFNFILKYDAGYLKDTIATILFTLYFIKLYKKKSVDYEFVMRLLPIGILIDLIFTLNPEFHCQPLGLNTPTFLVLAVSIVGIFYLFKK